MDVSGVRFLLGFSQSLLKALRHFMMEIVWGRSAVIPSLDPAIWAGIYQPICLLPMEAQQPPWMAPGSEQWRKPGAGKLALPSLSASVSTGICLP
jgi:hypothetical protein